MHVPSTSAPRLAVRECLSGQICGRIKCAIQMQKDRESDRAQAQIYHQKELMIS
jgi:hypothetical protein